MSSSRKPTPDELAQARALIQSGPVVRRRFFSGLKHPGWALPLLEAGACDYVLSDGTSDDTRYGWASSWPAGAYIMRMVPGNPKLIQAVMQRRKLRNNLHVRAALLAAIENLTAQEIRPLVPQLVEWVENIRRIENGEMRYAAIILKLLKGNQVDEATELAGMIWSVAIPSPDDKDEEDKHNLAHGGYPHSTGVLSENRFMGSIRQVSPEMILAKPCETLDIFRKVLVDCVLLERSQRTLDQDKDFSFVWRAAVEPHSQNGTTDWRDLAIDAVRDSSVECCKKLGSTSEALTDVVSRLESFESPIFQRIAFHVCRQFPSEFRETSSLVDKAFTVEMFQSPYVHHELYMLVQDVLPMLSEDQKVMLVTNWSKAYSKLDSDESSNYIRSEVLGWFSRVEEYLPEPFRQRVAEAYEAGLTVPDHPEFGVYIQGGFLGRRSPFSADELAAMPIREVIGVLREWEPSGNPLEDTPIHLAGTLAETGSLKIVELLNCLQDCIDLDPTYWIGILGGIQNCIRDVTLEEKQWRVVIEFIRTVCVEAAKRPTDVDTWFYHHPMAALCEAGGLLREALGRDLLSLNLMPEVWRAIEDLMSNAEPEYSSDSPDELFNFTLNSAFGIAHHCAVSFVHSVHRLLDRKSKAEVNFLELTGVAWDTLSGHLILPPETSNSVRAVCGGHMPVLHGLNLNWVTQNRERIFPHGENEYERWCMAWAPYVKYCHPHKGVTQFLHSEYEHALSVRQSAPAEIEESEWWWRYIEHICVMTITGEIDEVPNGFALWERFIAECGERSLDKAIGFIGRGLSHETSDPKKEVLPSGTIERAKRIWSGVLRQLASEPKDSARRYAASAFGWWALARQLDPTWVLENLIEVVDIAGQIDDLRAIIRRLADDNVYSSCMLLQLMFKIVQNKATEGLIVVDADDLRRIFRRIGRQSHKDRQYELKTCLKYFIEWDLEGFTELYHELCD